MRRALDGAPEHLKQTLDAECLSIDQAAEVTERIAVEVGLDPDVQIRMTTTVDDGATCTQATLTVCGAIFSDLRGRASN